MREPRVAKGRWVPSQAPARVGIATGAVLQCHLHVRAPTRRLSSLTHIEIRNRFHMSRPDKTPLKHPFKTPFGGFVGPHTRGTVERWAPPVSSYFVSLVKNSALGGAGPPRRLRLVGAANGRAPAGKEIVGPVRGGVVMSGSMAW